MVERDPLYLATDSAGDPSALAVFVAGDTIPSGFMSSSLSATNLTIENSINVSANQNLMGVSISSIESSASVGFTNAPLPTPPPFIWVRANTAGVSTTSEKKFGNGSTNIGVSSVPNYFAWGTIEVLASSTGIYKIQFNGIVVVAGTQIVTLNLYVGTDIVHSVSPVIHGVTDPHLIGLNYVGPVTAGEAIYVGRVGDGAQALNFDTNSTLLIERVG